MERVKIGEKYWLIRIDVNGVKVYCHEEGGWESDKRYFEDGNYFHTEEEAEAMAEKLRAVLKGADVIEMPTDEEIEKELKDSLEMGGYSEDTWTENAYEDGFINSFNWLKSKMK